MKTGKLIYKIFLSLCYIGSAVCFFFPFLKITINTALGSIDADLIVEYIFGESASELTSFSPLDVIKLCFNAPDFIDSNKLFIEALFFFVIPFLLALASAVMVHFLKSIKSAGLFCGVAGLVGALMNILMRVFLSINNSNIFDTEFSLSDILSVDLPANICLAVFSAAAIASFVMMFVFKESETDAAIPPINYSSEQYGNENGGYAGYDNNGYSVDNNGYAADSNGYGYDNNGYAADNNGYGYDNNGGYAADNNGYGYDNNSYGNGGFRNIVDDDTPTERVIPDIHGNLDDDSPTVRLVRENQVQENRNKAGIIKGREGMYAGMNFPINVGEEIIIGRDSSQAHIVLDKKYIYVSKKHCGIRYEAGERFRIIVYSSNGIFINGRERVEQGAEIYLSPGSVISVGNKDNSFELSAK